MGSRTVTIQIRQLVAAFLTAPLLLCLAVTPLRAQARRASDRPIHGLGSVHMDTSCSPGVRADFDRALALLHNFWYARALEAFTEVAQRDPDCAVAYWGAAMTYNHPFWDPPTRADESAAWAFVQTGMRATRTSPRESMYLAAVAALYKGGGAGPKSARDQAYVDAMAAAFAVYPDDEIKLFYGLALLGTVKEGSKGFERQGLAAKLFEEVYAKNPRHPGVLHYLIHVYDDPDHAAEGLKAARAYAATAPAVPHAQHMPSHIFTRLGYWTESATTNENAWRTSEADVKRAGESGAYRDFHALNYLQYAYLQLGRFQDAKRVTGIVEAQYGALSNKTTAPDTPDLQARHVRGRTIYALPDRVAYGYFDMLARWIVESGDWSGVATVPLVAPSRDFRAMKYQLEAMAAAKRGDPRAAKAAADEVERLAGEPGQHPLAQTIIALQAKEAQAVAAHAAADDSRVITMMTEAIAIEDSIEALSQPPYPIIPAHEVYGTLLMEMKRPAEAAKHFAETLRRTPGRPMAVYGLARVAEALGDRPTALARYTEFLELWKHADPDRPELAIARRFVRSGN
jgi:tetratricopeptide (TPR) repeat protein